MFSPAARTRLRESLLRAACADKRLSGVAVTGSAAVDREDAWSDIDLVLGVADRPNLYRAFLTASTLQVDLNFVPGAEFGPAGPKFRLVAGAPARRQHATANDATANKATSPDHLAGMGWLYAVQARSCVERGKLWQAERMVSGLREQVLALACLRHGCAAEQATGADQLPSALQARARAWPAPSRNWPVSTRPGHETAKARPTARPDGIMSTWWCARTSRLSPPSRSSGRCC